jgi:hypothetical protein
MAARKCDLSDEELLGEAGCRAADAIAAAAPPLTPEQRDFFAGLVRRSRLKDRPVPHRDVA